MKVEKPSPSERRTPKLALIPLRNASSFKNKQNQQQKPLEAKQFPIVLGRTNLSQWWYQSCDCQQYYCRLHCRPVAKNIGSLSKVMIQIDTKGTAHIVGKNPHLVTIITPERNNNSENRSTYDANDTGSKDDKITKSINIEKKHNDDHQEPIILRAGDILSIGRRDREPWMRFQIIENTSANNAISSSNTNNKANGTASMDIESKDINASVDAKAREITYKEARPDTSKQTKPALSSSRTKTKAQTGASVDANNTHHDAQLPEWITTTTTTSTATGKRSRLSSSYHNYGATDTKEQQHHQAMVATLTRAAAAAGAAADADERNKSKKHYRYNSYYNYYNQSNNEVDSNGAQRKRRRHNSSSFAQYHPNPNNKSPIRSAEDLFHIGSSRRGDQFQGHYNDPQIHLAFQGYETSARLIHAGTRQGRNQMRMSKEIYDNGEPQFSSRQRKVARTDRNFIGNPSGQRTNDGANTSAIVYNSDRRSGEEKEQNQQSKSVGLLSKNYAAALMEVSTHLNDAPVEIDHTVLDNMEAEVIRTEYQGVQS